MLLSVGRSCPVLWVRSLHHVWFLFHPTYLHVYSLKIQVQLQLQTRVAPRLCSTHQTQLLVFSADHFFASKGWGVGVGGGGRWPGRGAIQSAGTSASSIRISSAHTTAKAMFLRTRLQQKRNQETASMAFDPTFSGL